MSDTRFEASDDRAQRLGKAIIQCVRDFYRNEPGITQGEVESETIIALNCAIANYLVSIECPHCRRSLAKTTKRLLPKLVAEVLTEAAKLDATRPSSAGSTHTH